VNTDSVELAVTYSCGICFEIATHGIWSANVSCVVIEVLLNVRGVFWSWVDVVFAIGVIVIIIVRVLVTDQWKYILSKLTNIIAGWIVSAGQIFA